jgi:glutamate racemase
VGNLSVEIKDRCIGVFDSGLGGLTVVKAMKKILPNENIIYLGDTGRAPYGGKDKGTIMEYACQDIAFFRPLNVKVIVAACGTVSSYLEKLENADDVLGVIKPTCFAAVNSTKNGRIGVMGTAAAVNSMSYEHCITGLNPNLTVYRQACPLLVPLIESGVTTEDSAELREAVELYTKPLVRRNIDTLVLGCTHYPIIKSVIQKVIGNEITVIDSGEETAKFVRSFLDGRQLISQRQMLGEQKFFVSGDVKSFSETAKKFLGYDICENVAKIDVSNY